MSAPLFSIKPLCVAIGAVVVLTVPAAAATNLNSSRSNIYKPIASTADEQVCKDRGGIVVILDGKRQCELPADAAAGGTGPVEGVTLQCDLGASGDPLKGLNVSKPGGNKGNVECN